MRPGLFFDLNDGKRLNSIIYRDHILTESLQEFWEESFGSAEEPIVMKINATSHKKVCIPVRQELGMRCHQYSPNSSDLNPIKNI